MRTDILIYKTARDIQKKYNAYFREAGLPSLTFTQYIVLRELWNAPEGTMSEKEIGQALILDSGTLTPVLKSLEKSGLISRTRSKADERVVNAVLSAKGREIAFKLPFRTEEENDSLAQLIDGLDI